MINPDFTYYVHSFAFTNQFICDFNFLAFHNIF